MLWWALSQSEGFHERGSWVAVGETETGSLSDVLPTPSSPPADAPVGPGEQAGSGEGGLEEAGLFTRLRVLENRLGVRHVVSWHFRTGHRRLHLAKKCCVLQIFFEAGRGRPVSPVKVGWFSSLISRGFRSLPFAASNPFAFGKGSPTEIHSQLPKPWQLT